MERRRLPVLLSACTWLPLHASAVFVETSSIVASPVLLRRLCIAWPRTAPPRAPASKCLPPLPSPPTHPPTHYHPSSPPQALWEDWRDSYYVCPDKGANPEIMWFHGTENCPGAKGAKAA